MRGMNRRNFLKTTAVTGGSLMLAPSTPAAAGPGIPKPISSAALAATPRSRLPDLSPARWVWYPSGRTLQNTFVLFRRELQLSVPPRRATGWIAADSRYRLELNGQRVQWGPAPSDPRWPETDPVDLTSALKAGTNVLGATVLFYGCGDGTWPIGKPGFLFWLEIEHADGRIERIVSDDSWKTLLCRAWLPGHYKRWYLRALQEEFDARLYPQGWAVPGFRTDNNWLGAMALDGSPNQPALSAGYYEYMLDVGGGPPDAELRPRSIPLLRESFVPVARLAETYRLTWRTTPQDYFDFRTPDAFAVQREDCARPAGPGQWQVELDGSTGVALTFEFTEQVVGWPAFAIEAPAGTTIELLVHEAHAPGGPPLLNTHFDSWTRFICREGRNEFETFDFESLRWLQLHIHGAKGPLTVSEVRVRRRVFPWPNAPRIRTHEPELQRLFDASINTLNNSAQETLVDGMARERQQYSGDGGHQLHAVHLTFGEQRLVARYLTTFSQGITKDGFFLDCWPAYDRLARLIERQLDLSSWGPILDHGVGFNFDCWSHYLYTGDLGALREPFPRLVRFAQYLQGLVRTDGLLPVEDIGIPSVWIDHVAYQRQRHKRCAFNLYAAAAMQHALAPMCRAFGQTKQAEAVAQFGTQLQQAAIARFWSPERGLFINNLPWLEEEKNTRTCDRSLATAILFDQCPGGQTAIAVRSLAECPPEMGFSYPANAGWRLWALAKAGRADVIVSDLRARWAPMLSVKENNTLQEDWQARHDSGQQWSHCAVVPLCIAFHGLMGLKPIEPGFKRFELRPQLGGLNELDLTAFTVPGPIKMHGQGKQGEREVLIQSPPAGEGELVLPEGEAVALPMAPGPVPAGHRRYRLPVGATVTLRLQQV
jgi:alpha-L-rhamnosidase